jgi:hypothetical protein
MSTRKRLLAMAAAVAMWTAIQPSTVSAQTSGVGGDGYTRFSWRATDDRISVWKLDQNLNPVLSHEYGPYPGWVVRGITVAHNNNTCVLWRYSDGSISLWLLDANLIFVTSHAYGPYAGWSAVGLGVTTDGTTSNYRVIWRNTNGSVSVWSVDQNLNFVSSQQAGPFFGYDPGYVD